MDVFDRDRNTPLHILASTFPALRANHNEIVAKAEEIVSLFINAGVHVDAVNIDGCSAAKSSSSREYFNSCICF